MAPSLIEVLGCAVGGAVAGTPGAITGAIAGKLMELLPAPDEFIKNIIQEIATDTISDSARKYWSQRKILGSDGDKRTINHHLQTAFRDAVQKGLYDIGGRICFPDIWKQQRDVPHNIVYWHTERGQLIFNHHPSQVDEISTCLRWLDQRIEQNELLPLEPLADQALANSEIYLIAATPQELSDQFFQHIIQPQLRPFSELEFHFKQHLRTYLLDRTLVHLGETLKEKTEVWRAFNRLIVEQLRIDVRAVNQGQQTLLDRLGQLELAITTPAWTSALPTLIAEFGRLDKEQHDSFQTLFKRLSTQHRELLDGISTILDHIRTLNDNIQNILQSIQPHALFQPQPASMIPHTVPPPVGDFFGRQQEIDELVAELQRVNSEEHRHKTNIWWIHGLPGVGKTQFAYAVAQRVKNNFPDGQILLDMQGTSDAPMQVGEVLAKVIRLFDRDQPPPTDLGDQRERYIQLLENKQVLIIADTVHLKTQVEPLITPPNGCALLILSRRRLVVAGANRWELPTMRHKEAEEWIGSVGLTPYATQLAKLCGYLPLALRISTTLLQEIPRPQIKRYLEKLQNERLRLSGFQDPDHPNLPDHSVAASLALSYETLDTLTRRAFACLGVFIGSFEAAAATKVLDLPEDTDSSLSEAALSSLVRLGLLSLDQTQERYILHDLVRIFALEHLQTTDDEAAIRKRHAEYYVMQAENANAGLNSMDQVQWLHYLEAEYNNMVTAAQWSQTHDQVDLAARITSSLWAFWTMRGTVNEDGTSSLREGRQWLEQLLAGMSLPTNEQAKQLRAKLLNQVALFTLSQGEHIKAQALFEESLRYYHDLNDRRGIAGVQVNLAMVAEQAGMYNEALHLYEQGLQVFRDLSHQWEIAAILHNIGVLYYTQNKYGEAQRYHEESLAIREAEGFESDSALSLENLGWIALALDNYTQAEILFTNSLKCSWKLKNYGHLIYCLEGLGGVAGAQHDGIWAARLWGAAEQVRKTIGAPIQTSDLPDYLKMTHAVESELGTALFTTTKKGGYAASLEVIVQEALNRVLPDAEQPLDGPSSS